MSTANELISPIEIFYSYSHKDEKLRKKLETHLSLLKQQGALINWYDRKIGAGKEWANEIDTHLNTAQIILLLVSPDFLASEYCYSIEMKHALERHEHGEARVIPIILRPVYWQEAPFGNLQALPTDARPITGSSWHNQDEAFLDITQSINNVIKELKKKLEAKPVIKKSDNPWDKYILAIDDDEAILEMIKTILEIEGYNVVTTIDGQTALIILQKQQFNLILLDITFQNSNGKLIGMQGFEILNQLREMGNKAPIIMISMLAAYKKAFNLGVADYIYKPFNADELIARVKARIK